MPTFASTRAEFRQNLGRVDNLIAIYQDVTGTGSGRRPVDAQDVLRAAITFLHATLENLLRGLLRLTLPEASVDMWKNELHKIPLPGKPTGSRFELHHLAYHRGKTVDEVLRDAVDCYLDDSNFNNVGQIKSALNLLHLDEGLVDGYAAQIGPLMARRHHIVHQLDSNRTQTGSGHHVAKSLSKVTVEHWRDSVQQFGEKVLNTLEEKNQ